MAARTPEERAIADVEKAIKDHQKAEEKYEAASAKADEAAAAATRVHRELMWKSLHPDLPEDFDLDDFRKSLEAPFEETDLRPIIEEHELAVGKLVAAGDPEDVPVVDDAADEQDRPDLQGATPDVEEDPWGEDE